MKNLYDLLNDAWIDFSEYEEIPVTEQEREQMMKKIRRTNQKQKSRKRIAWAAACAASLALVSQTSFAKELIRQVIGIGNSSVVIYEEEQTEGTNAQVQAAGTDVEADPAENSENTVSFATESELEEKLSFDLKIPDSIPEGYELEQAYTWRGEDGTITEDYAVLVYGDGNRKIQIHERKDEEGTGYSTNMSDPQEIEFHGTTAVYNDQAFVACWDGTNIYIIGNEEVNGEAFLEVANSLK